MNICFILLTIGLSHKPVYFNILQIRAIEPTLSGSKVYTDSAIIDVAESPEQVYNNIKECK